MLRRTSLALFLAAACVASAPLAAADITALLDTAGAAAKAKDHDAAIAALQQALDAVRRDAPLGIERFMLVNRPAASFGDFDPRANAEYSGSEALQFYMEPKNLVYGRNGGAYIPAFEVDLYLLDADAEPVATKEKFGSFKLPSKSPVQDIFLNLTVTMTGAPPGEYVVRFVVRDLNSDKRATVEKSVTLK